MQLSSNSTQVEKTRQDVSTLEETLAKKTKEIYELTVQLGCLKEENHQFKRDQEDSKVEFEERLDSQKERAEAEYRQLEDDYQSFQQKYTCDAQTMQRDAE